MNEIPLHKVKDNLSKYIDLAADEEIVVTRHGRPAAVIVGFKDEDAWFDYRLENDERFLARIERSRQQLREGALCGWKTCPIDPHDRLTLQARGV
ncbi:MAG: type II toxin-antitoxin system Phd/YefM family antitoxin [Thermoanaerobaculia bacterium]|nr:type II toxin-antitoxin system Phd/YefM family antitoxin [Thermoanaerobaculia bacterium]